MCRTPSPFYFYTTKSIVEKTPKLDKEQQTRMERYVDEQNYDGIENMLIEIFQL